MATAPLKRLKYFTGQFLEAKDFEDEQKYHMDMRRLGTRALYFGAGILDDGFIVTQSDTPGQIMISPGVAVDGEGHELVLLTDLPIALPSGAAGTRFVALTYNPLATDKQVAGDQVDVSDYTRWDETPRVGFPTAAEPGSVVIARIEVDSAGGLVGPIDDTVRQRATARFVGNVTAGGALTVGTGADGQHSGLTILGANAVADSREDVSFKFAAAGSAKIRAYRGYSWDTYLQFQTNSNDQGNDNPQVRLHIGHDGNVGIGTSAPKAALHVEGVGLVSDGDGYAVPNNFMARGSLTIGSIASNFGGGSGWNPNTAGLLLETLDNTEIAIHDSSHRLASVVQYQGGAENGAGNSLTIGRDMGFGAIKSVVLNGNVGIGTSDPQDKLEIHGGLRVLGASNPIRFSDKWSGFPDQVPNQAEISNDTGSFKTLMIVGNQSAGLGRRVSVWDRLEVNGHLEVAGNVGVGTSAPKAALHVEGVGLVSDGDGYAVPNNFMARGSLTIGSIASNFGGGSGWNPNTAGLLLETLDNTEIAIHDSSHRVASVVQYQGGAENGAGNSLTIGRDMGFGAIKSVVLNGNVGIGTSDPQDKLDVCGSLRVGASNPIRFSDKWSFFPDQVLNQAEISNDTDIFKTLMIVGNKSAGLGRRVSVWDRLEVHGQLEVDGQLRVTGDIAINGGINWGGDKSSSDRYIILGNLQICWGELYTEAFKQNENQQEVRFPKVFGNRPVVTVSLDDPGYGSGRLTGGVAARNVSVSGFTVFYKDNNKIPYKNENNTTIVERLLTFFWIAMGPRATNVE